MTNELKCSFCDDPLTTDNNDSNLCGACADDLKTERDRLMAEVAKMVKEIRRLNRINANSVSKMELDTCRSLNETLREDNVRLLKELKKFKGLARKRIK